MNNIDLGPPASLAKSNLQLPLQMQEYSLLNVRIHLHDGWGAVTWSSKHQTTVALFTVKAEYVAMSQCTQQMVWMQSVKIYAQQDLNKGVSTLVRKLYISLNT